MREARTALVSLAALVALATALTAGCGGRAAGPAASPTAPPAVPADITGVIYDLTRDAGTGLPVLAVVDDGALQGNVDRATVTVTGDTVVWMLKGGRGAAGDLAAGQMVSVWFEGPVAESYPVQARAGVVRILLED